MAKTQNSFARHRVWPTSLDQKTDESGRRRLATRWGRKMKIGESGNKKMHFDMGGKEESIVAKEREGKEGEGLGSRG